MGQDILLKNQYLRIKKTLLSDKKICSQNIKLYTEFFKHQENKLKRINNLQQLDPASYKTLLGYVYRYKNIEKWFKHKNLKLLTKKDISKVYNQLEDGKIVTSKGTPLKDRTSYYNKVFKGKLFKLAGKEEIAREVLEYFRPNEQSGSENVRFIKRESVVQIIDVMTGVKYKGLGWLAFDIGENIMALLQLKKKDCTRIEKEDKTIYHINLRKDILKRKRTPRTEPTRFSETTKLLDILLKDKKPDEYIFTPITKQGNLAQGYEHLSYPAARKALNRAVDITKSICIPNGEKVTWEDFRHSMACDLLKDGISVDRINKRLGHKASSREIDKYVNFLAIDRDEMLEELDNRDMLQTKRELEKAQQKLLLAQKTMEAKEQTYKKVLAEVDKKVEELKQKETSMEQLAEEVSEKYGKVSDELSSIYIQDAREKIDELLKMRKNKKLKVDDKTLEKHRKYWHSKKMTDILSNFKS